MSATTALDAPAEQHPAERLADEIAHDVIPPPDDAASEEEISAAYGAELPWYKRCVIAAYVWRRGRKP